MKNHLFTLILVALFALSANAQDVFINLDVDGIVNKKINKDLAEGTKFQSLRLVSTASQTGGYQSDTKTITLITENVNRTTMHTIKNLPRIWNSILHLTTSGRAKL